MLASDKILALDIGASSVKVGEFQASKTHGLRLTNFNYADLGLDPDHEENRKALIISTLRNALRERNMRAARVVFSVSGQSVFTRFVKLPPVDESKVVQIIQYEAQQNVPFPIEEVIWDYQLIGSTEKGELEVVLLAIKSDIIEDLNDGIESVGLRTDTVDVAPMALYNAVRYNEGENEGCTLVVDIGARTTNLLFIEKHRIFSRSIPIAGNAITQSIAAEFEIPFRDAEVLKKAKGFVALGGAYEEPEDEQQARVSKIIRNVMTRLHAEIGRSINFYRSQQNGSAPERMLLSGGSSVIPYTDRFFKEKLQVSVQYFNPFRNVEIAPNISRDELGKCAHFFGEVVGLGLRRLSECPLEVNLLPKSIQARKQLQRRKPFFVGAAVSLLLIPLCLLAFTNKTTTLKQDQLKDVRARVQRLEALGRTLQGEEQKLDQLRARMNVIATVVDSHTWWPQLLEDIGGRLTTNLWLVSVNPVTGTPAATPPPKPRGSTRGTRPPMDRPAEMAPSSTAITEIRILGAGNHSANDLRLVDEFKERLKNSGFFDKDGVEIEVPPPLMSKEPIFSFTLKAKLAEPLVF